MEEFIPLFFSEFYSVVILPNAKYIIAVCLLHWILRY